MWPDIFKMRDFYASPLGQMAEKMISQKIRQIWPDLKGRDGVVIGYTPPYAKIYSHETRHLLSLRPSEQGILSPSTQTLSFCILTNLDLLPLPDRCMDCVLMIHALEFTDSPREIIREVWRILADGGRLLLVVPNRLGLWSRLDTTPFGQGHTYSGTQITTFLQENMFTPLRTERALYIPPFLSNSLTTKMAPYWENMGHKCFTNLSGVILVEASKQVYAAHGLSESAWRQKMQFAQKLAMPPLKS